MDSNREMATGDAVADRHESIWTATTGDTDYESLDGETVTVDTAVVGGGIVGITTARHLTEAGQTVAVIESNRIASGVTAHSTAKLTSQHGLIYDSLVSQFGERRARLYAAANEAAIDEVTTRADAEGVDGDVRRTPAYTYTTGRKGKARIRDEVEAARRVGLDAAYTESTPLPYDIVAAVKFEEQAAFHPRAYLCSLAEGIVDDGSFIFEGATAQDVDRGRRCRVRTDRGAVVADDVVVATHFPFYDRGLYFARLTPKQSYVLAARLDGEVPEGMYYRHGNPYFSVRPQPAGEESIVLIGGQNHRTGHGGPTFQYYRKLEREARSKFDVASIEYRWSTQDFVAADGVPYVGKLAPGTDHVYVATGFGGWGLSNGTAAGMLLADLVRGVENPWRDVYRPTRVTPTASARRLMSHNLHAAKHFVRDRLPQSRPADVRGLDPGEAGIVESDEVPTAVYRDEDGDYHAVSAVCPHMGCTVTWNDAERTWDCPCHASRFEYDGDVVDGPAVEPLPAARLELAGEESEPPDPGDAR